MAGLQKLLRLGNGRRMPAVGVGTFFLNGDACKEIIDRALYIGYKLIDTAHSYGNEKDIGDAIRTVEKNGKLKRRDVFITTKVPNVFLAPKDVKASVEASLENLNTTYIDLLLIHSPWGLKNREDGNMRHTDADGNYEFEHYDLLDTWKAFEELFWAGKAKSIGVSNFTPKQLSKIIQYRSVVPHNVQFECHAYLQQRTLKTFCDQHGIVCTAFGPLGAPGRPPHHLSGSEDEADIVLENGLVKEISEKHKKTPAQILLRFTLENGFAIIPKTSDRNRLEENANIFDFQFSKSEIEQLQALDRGLRYFKFVLYHKHPEFTKRNEPF